MTISEKRRKVQNYCNSIDCNHCILKNNWFSENPDNNCGIPGRDECVDISLATESDLDKALGLIGLRIEINMSPIAELSKQKRHFQICKELNELYQKKNHDYGDSFHKTFVEEGMAMPRIRLGDKYNRFCTLTRNTDRKVSDESIRDTLIDLANYAIMTVLEMEGNYDEMQ